MSSSSPLESSLASSVTNTEKDIFDNLNLSKIVSEYLKNYDAEDINKDEEERLKFLSETESHIYFSYESYLFWKEPNTQNLHQDILQTFVNFQNSFEFFLMMILKSNRHYLTLIKIVNYYKAYLNQEMRKA